MTDTCQHCGNEYRRIALHWAKSDCSHPNLTREQREVTTGLLMGDGNINSEPSKKPRLRTEMISRSYLEHIDSVFGILSNGVKLSCRAEENAENCRNSGFSPNAKAENYSDVYVWYSMRHPAFREFEEWYSSGQKVWPDNIELEPTVLKHWYCGDGTWDNNGSSNRIIIAMSNEASDTEKIDRMFESVGLPSPNNYYTNERPTKGGTMCHATFTVEQSKKLWEYMGKPLPDFQYKWPEQYR